MQPRSNLSSHPKDFITPEKTAYQAEILSNRLKKQFRHFSRKYKKQDIDCFRLYDWDIKEVRAVVDWYAGHVVIAEYEREQTGDDWLPRMAQATAEALNISEDHLHMKTRRTKTEEGLRYGKLASKNERFQVREHHLKFWVNLDDFLDTGLYSDHRDTRGIVGKMAEGKDFLNLYAYTGAFTCAAAAGKAKTSTTVDRSATNLQWAEDNLRLNGLDGQRHKLIQLDVNEYLKVTQKEGRKFTLCFVDPPSFFQDKDRKVSFDINRDHPQLLQDVFKVMAPGSTVIFSTNHQRFEPRLEGLAVKDLQELTPKTIPEDYRNKKIHRCWKMSLL